MQPIPVDVSGPVFDINGLTITITDPIALLDVVLKDDMVLKDNQLSTKTRSDALVAGGVDADTVDSLTETARLRLVQACIRWLEKQGNVYAPTAV